jgi:hypothetical protein
MCFPESGRPPLPGEGYINFFFQLVALYSITEYIQFGTTEFNTRGSIPHLAWQVRWAQCNLYPVWGFPVYSAIALILMPYVVEDPKGNSKFG